MDNSQVLITKNENLNYYVPTEITIPEEDGKYNLAINVQDGQASYVTEESGSSSALPEVTEADNGDVLTVVNGSWNKATPSGGGDSRLSEPEALFDITFTLGNNGTITGSSMSFSDAAALIENAQLSAPFANVTVTNNSSFTTSFLAQIGGVTGGDGHYNKIHFAERLDFLKLFNEAVYATVGSDYSVTVASSYTTGAMMTLTNWTSSSYPTGGEQKFNISFSPTGN